MEGNEWNNWFLSAKKLDSFGYSFQFNLGGEFSYGGSLLWFLALLSEQVVVGLGGTPLHANRPILGLAFVFNSSQPSKLALDVPIRQLKLAPAFWAAGGGLCFYILSNVFPSRLNYENEAAKRKVYVEDVPCQMSAQRLLAHFSSYGEVKGPIGFDRRTGKSQGFALFEYKTADGARASLVDPTKIVDSHHLICRYANDEKKGKQPSSPPPPLMLHYGGLGESVGSGGSGWWVQTPTIDLGAGGLTSMAALVVDLAVDLAVGLQFATYYHRVRLTCFLLDTQPRRAWTMACGHVGVRSSTIDQWRGLTTACSLIIKLSEEPFEVEIELCIIVIVKHDTSVSHPPKAFVLDVVENSTSAEQLY
ncbi:hypothetical protein RJ639_039867 [Escallonia herrerae]|uniref:RRM domain-containing protein n=1 Tax=Escallonia herrerae TaxID=1293975 RepID=A0AA89B5I4_9ASTE|nr:hypothetical protein RJ639_039867 [Escallonia herrerae]